MIQKGSLVMLVDMYSEYSTGFDRSWLEGAVGYVLHDPKGKSNSKGEGWTLVNMITPLLSLKDNPIKWECAHTVNMVELTRVPISTPVVRKPIKLQGDLNK